LSAGLGCMWFANICLQTTGTPIPEKRECIFVKNEKEESKQSNGD